LLPLGAEFVVFQIYIQKYEEQDIQNNFFFLLYGCEIWSLTLTKESRVLRKIFGSKSVEVTGEWRRLHKEEFYDLYSLPNIIR